VVLGNDGIWYCQQSRDRYSQIDMNRACQWQYNDPAAFARQTDPNNPQTWVCYRGEAPPPGPQPRLSICSGRGLRLPAALDTRGASGRDWRRRQSRCMPSYCVARRGNTSRMSYKAGLKLLDPRP
jgi:hypothetical protein